VASVFEIRLPAGRRIQASLVRVICHLSSLKRRNIFGIHRVIALRGPTALIDASRIRAAGVEQLVDRVVGGADRRRIRPKELVARRFIAGRLALPAA